MLMWSFRGVYSNTPLRGIVFSKPADSSLFVAFRVSSEVRSVDFQTKHIEFIIICQLSTEFKINYHRSFRHLNCKYNIVNCKH